jgi:hypothetical protein
MSEAKPKRVRRKRRAKSSVERLEDALADFISDQIKVGMAEVRKQLESYVNQLISQLLTPPKPSEEEKKEE